MAGSKISDETVRLIVELDRQSKKPEEIAHILRLKPIHVRTILASRTMTQELAEQQTPPHQSFSSNGSAESVRESGQVVATHEVGEVEEVEADTSEQMNADEGVYPEAVFVGEDEDYQDSLHWEPSNPKEVPNPHLMIMGESGSGKTYSAQCLIAELALKGIPSIIFDYGQSFELQHLEKPFQKFVKIREHVIGDAGLPINPLQIFSDDAGGPKRVATRVSDVFDAVYRLGDIQRKVVIDAILKAFKQVGIDDSDPKTWSKPAPTLTELQQVLDDLSADKTYANAKNATGVSARMVTFFMLGSEVSTTWSWDELLASDAKVHILQFRGLEGKTQRVLVELLLWHFFYFLKNRGAHPLSVFNVLDEAHHLSFRENGPVDSLLREARKFGLGIIFASQQPADFSDAAFANSASKLVFQTTDPSGKVSRLLAAKCSNHEDANEIKQLISQLKQGHAFFISKNKGYRISVADFKKRATLWQQSQ
ncbi:MAG: ATP-binding protein [Acidobacteriales bacterium]|nr:ATP-binding protein [Terriglobales bacterium]